jgi:DNA-binding NtrC family response regulator
MSTLSKKIFVVDDDRFHLEMMEQILRSNEATEVVLFEDGIKCLQEIHQNPAIVFLDHQMDEYSGYETLKKIKRHNPNIFVVMVSAQESIQTAVDALKYGAFDYLQKDLHLDHKIVKVLKQIETVKEQLKIRKPSFLKSVLNFL